MDGSILSNPVLIAVAALLVMAVMRLNVVFALVAAALVGGLWANLSLGDTTQAFAAALGNGAGIAMNYAMLGALSVAISRSGITELVALGLFRWIGRGQISPRQLFWFKYSLLGLLTLIAISSQNAIPVHIAFIPILIPPLLQVFERIHLDRRAVACVLTFGLITPYMVLPVGFGKIYLDSVLIGNILDSGLAVSADMAPRAMLIPALGMVAGLLIAVFISYRKPRYYNVVETAEAVPEPLVIRPWKAAVGVVAIIIGLCGQIIMDGSLIFAALAAIAVFVIARVIKVSETQDVFTEGVRLMGGIGLVMIAAAGFAGVMKATGGIDQLVQAVSAGVGDYRALAVFLMLLIGLIITMGIGSSFSTVPLIAAIYVPLCMQLEISPLATIAIVGTAGALGDAGSPVSESVLGPTSGLNADGQHDHIYDSTIPTFLHYNLPLLAAGWIAGMVL